MTTFSEKLKQARKKNGWSQDEMGTKVGIHGRHIGKYETGRALPNAETIIRIAQVLNLSIDYLLRDDFDEKDTPDATLSARWHKYDDVFMLLLA